MKLDNKECVAQIEGWRWLSEKKETWMVKIGKIAAGWSGDVV